MKNTKVILSIFILFFLLITLTSINAASENDTQETFSDVSTPLKSDLNTGNNEQTSTTHVLNTSSFNDYVTDGKFNEKVNDGDTIDFQGKLDSPKFALNVNKPVNIISSTGDAYYDIDTTPNAGSGINNYDNIFVLSNGGSGTNITGITFHNTQVRIINASEVCVDNITLICESNIGNRVGSFNVRGSNNITVKNSYFMNYPNGGHSNVVIAGVSNCLIENNTIQCDNTNGMTGNLLYLTTYYSNGLSNNNITIRNNLIRTFGPSYPTNYGLALQGSGHIIEGNVIDNDMPVMAQYADSDYGMETNIDSIIFNNNTILRGAPQLVFPGIVANNTFNGGALLKQVQAYNNTFNRVTIQNNVKFENNTAKNIIVTGNNSILDNNEIYSDEDYAVNITGENNTLTNNKLLSNKGYGEDTICNSAEYVSVNNSERLPRVFYINDDNINEYFDDVSSASDSPVKRSYAIKDDVILDGDILVFDLSPKLITLKGKTTNVVRNVVIKDSLIDGVGFSAYNLKGNVSIVNSRILHSFSRTGYSLELINSTIKGHAGYTFSGENYTIIYTDYGKLEADGPINNTYILSSYKSYAYSNGKPRTIFDENGYIKSNITSFSKILVVNFDDSDLEIYTSRNEQPPYLKEVYINKPLNFTAMYDDRGNIASDVHLIEGSEQTFFEGIKFDGNVLFETGNMEFYNCTFNNDLILNQSNIIFDGCTFNGKVTLNSSNNNIFNNNIFKSTDSINVFNSRGNMFENNTVNTTGGYAIVFDDDSGNNIVRYNTLVAISSFGDYSVVVGDNIVEDNTPAYNTRIIIDADSQYFADETPEIIITVNDIVNSLPVTKGYAEIYYDGYFIAKKDLINGQVGVTLPSLYNVGNYPIKVWYYDGLKYNNNVTKVNVNLVKSNVTITFDEFTAKMNEKTTVTATFLNQNGNPVSDTNITFTVGRSSYTVETVDGVATLNEMVTREWLDAGKIAVSLPSTDAYNANSTTITLNISKADVLMVPVVSVDGNVADVELTLSDDLGQNVTDGRIVLSTLDGQELASGRVSNGKFISNVALPEGYSDEYLVANFTGSYYYNDFVRNVKITQMLNSTISLETNSPLYGEELVINGKLVDSKNTPIGGANLTLNLNGSKVIVTTNDDGEYNYTYTPGLGVNSLTVTFDGTVDVYGSSASKDVTIRDTDREMNEVLNRLDELTSENAKLKEQLENLTHLSNDLKEQLANQTSELSEQNAALQQQINTLSTIISALTDIIDKQNEQIAALTAPENTTIVLNQVTDAKYKANVVISGMLNSQKGMALSGQTVTLTIGDKTVDVTTKNGEFEYTTVFKSVGEQTVTASYAGSDNYVASDASVTFDVAKQDVVVTVDPIADSAYGDNVTITGKFSDVDGKAISNSNVRVFVNGKKFLAKTDKTGIYTLSVKVNALGENNVTVGYAGNDNYNSYEDTTTFKADKQDVVVTGTVINIPKVGENVTITGTFTDKNGKAIINSNVKILINGKKYYARTDSTGTYTFTTTVTSAGMNNVTVGYSGNDKYNSYEDVTTFNVEAQDVIVTVNPIEEVAVGDNITITGTFTDKYGKVIINSNVKILFNGKKYYARTDSTGTYTFTTTVTTEGINNITVGYAGSAKYNAYETSTTFMAKAE